MASNADFRPGDWICPTPNCQNHNFARQTACRRCGSMRPAEGVAIPPNFRAGDWICPACTNHNFARNATCRRCGSGNVPAPPQAMPQGPMPGMPMAPAMGGPPARGPLPPAFRPGDWMCNACNAHNFSSRSTCRECEAAKPADADQQFTPQNFAYGPGYAASAAYGAPYAAAQAQYAQAQYGLTSAYGYGTPASFSAGAGAQSGWKPGDWACPKPSCGFHNFARQATCKQCGSARPEEGGAAPVS
eukprot:comp23924_c0_seq1/m.42232 comp23924_c0_seq1/g.42232  ORF comp23924_c0_seq1/g.42232 comp23924_c0_seq1/m.42232 type:complete len:245 (-) comp23924_c0_seq1:558-1292(-)